MSEAEYTGSQFHHNPGLQIDPGPSDCHQTQDENYTGHTQFYGFDSRTSTRQFEFDVERALRPQNSQFQWHAPLETAPTTPNDLSNAASTLNPLAAPFQPQMFPQAPIRNSFTNDFQHQPDVLAPTTASQYFWNNQLDQFGRPIHQNQQWVLATPLRLDQSMRNDPPEALYGLQTPFTPRQPTAFHTRSETGIRGANLNSIEEIMGSAEAPGENQHFPNPNSAAAMTISSENVARVPMNRNILRDTYQWNQDTYQGPVAQSTQPQYPPTPATSGRNRRGASVSTQPGQIYQCDLCPKWFGRRHALNHHRRWHQRGFACDLCDKTFSAAKDLRRHFRAKHDRVEKHLFCNILGCKFRQEGFHRLDHLKRHHERKHPDYPWSPPATSSFGGG
jgi:hypothetical protein